MHHDAQIWVCGRPGEQSPGRLGPCWLGLRTGRL